MEKNFKTEISLIFIADFYDIMEGVIRVKRAELLIYKVLNGLFYQR